MTILNLPTPKSGKQFPLMTVDEIRTWLAEIADERTAMYEALKVFATFADGLPYFTGPSRPGDYSYSSSVVGDRTLCPADFQRAADVLARIEAQP